MIRRFRLLPLAVLLAFLPLPAQTETPPPPSLETALKNLEDSTLIAIQPRADDTDFQARELRSQLGLLRGHLNTGDYGDALSRVREYARESTSPEIRQRWEDLHSALLAEQNKAEDTRSTQLNAALRRAADAALAARTADAVDSIIEELQGATEKRPSSTPRARRDSTRSNNAINFLRQWQELLFSAESGDAHQARQQLRQLASGARRDTLLTRRQILDTGARLGLVPSEGEMEFATRLDAILLRAAPAALAATDPHALAPFLAELRELQGDLQILSQERTPVAKRIEAAIQFFDRWQDHLMALRSGAPDAAREILVSLSGNSPHLPIPRADIIALALTLPPEPTIRPEALFQDVTLATLETARHRITVAREFSRGRSANEFNRLLFNIDRLLLARRQLAAGRADDALAALRTPEPDWGYSATILPPEFERLLDAWWFEALPVLTGVVDLPAPETGDTALVHVRRLFDAAVSTADWTRAHRLALIENEIAPDARTAATNRAKLAGADPAAAIAAWLLAEKLASVNQLPAAARACRDALEAGAPPALETLILARLQTLPANL